MPELVKSIYHIHAQDSSGHNIAFSRFHGHLLLIVNIASRCGFSPQLEKLELLYHKYRKNGLEILAFPSNDFFQEPLSSQNLDVYYCDTKNHSILFFNTIHVRGSDIHPLYRFLINKKPGLLGTRSIKWNFTKFLISPSGDVLKRYGPYIDPLNIEKDIIKYLSFS